MISNEIMIGLIADGIVHNFNKNFMPNWDWTSKRLEAKLTKIQIQKVVSPESEFLKYPDIQEVCENEVTLDFVRPGNVSCPANCDSVTAEDYAYGMQEGMNEFLESFYSKILSQNLETNCVHPLPQKLELNLWSQTPKENCVYGLKENSMKLFQDSQEAVNANNIESKVLSKFCYVEVKLESTDEEQFESITMIPYTRRHCIDMKWA